MTKKIYLPRSTTNYCVIRAIYAVAENNSVSFGFALEKILMTDGLFESTLLELEEDSKFFANDVKIFKEEFNKKNSKIVV